MNIRSIKIATLAATIAGAPMLGVAANSQVALDSCVKAFMTTLSASKASGFKLVDSHYVADAGAADGSMLVLGGRSEMTLMAHDAHDHHAVARAVCTVNAQGEVIELHPEPLFTIEPY